MLTEFIRYLSAERRSSPLTVRNYKHDVGQFLAWLDFDEARSDPRSITADQVREWIIHRTEEGKIGAASMNREIASIRTLFRWLLRTGAIEKDICRTIPSLKTSRRLPAFIPESRMTAIVSECEEADGDFETTRNSLVILMFYACGLRLAELVGIDRDDFSADYASRVFPGKRLPGHMGCVRVTVQNLTVVKVDTENNLIAVKGAVPGSKGTIITLANSVKA